MADKGLTELSEQFGKNAKEQQQARLQADLPQLAEFEPQDSILTRYLYGDNWQDAVSFYRAKKKQQKKWTVASTIVGGAGLVVCLMCGLWGLTRLATASKPTSSLQPTKQVQKESSGKSASSQPSENHKKDSPSPKHVSNDESATITKNESSSDSASSATSTKRKSMPTLSRAFIDADYHSETKPIKENYFSSLMTDQTPLGVIESPKTNMSAMDSIMEKSLESQSDDLSKKISDLNEKVHHLQDHPQQQPAEPINQALEQLTGQISAIREFAASHQDRLERLQSGYDWGIIRSFCLRIIRCIDNLETRITQQEKSKKNTSHLTDVRDELLFALESSGVEQFDLKINSPYQGQESCAEVLKEKEPSPSPDLKGCIAKVLRPGYQFVIDEDTVRVVRMARVRLYD